MNKDTHNINHRRIAELLNRSAGQLDPQIVASLHQASAAALQKQGAHQHAFSLSTIGHRAHKIMPHSANQWLATTVLLAAIAFSIADYLQQSPDQHNLDIDILTDELPIEVFVDQ